MNSRSAYFSLADQVPWLRASLRSLNWRERPPQVTVRAIFNSHRCASCVLPQRVLSGLAAVAGKTARSTRRFPDAVLMLVAPLIFRVVA